MRRRRMKRKRKRKKRKKISQNKDRAWTGSSMVDL